MTPDIIAFLSYSAYVASANEPVLTSVLNVCTLRVAMQHAWLASESANAALMLARACAELACSPLRGGTRRTEAPVALSGQGSI